ncbi:hypothetical protein N8J89_13855 [Crossiella sp. CA-258035]|uniref:hypothetical protein n=1 Tax=Crossiella sp. CA-258035 TaxID=2981138 RepID=UPI0024BD5824|nr:hypothetical protein [Crossiella sp. CA-258035]WHT22102.1 hypothetical protein N8J89_13855 [Crossiella sp. CA-258035]
MELFAAADYRRTEVLCQLPCLADLALFSTVRMPDLGFVRELRGLQTLSLDHLGRIEDYSPLDELISLWRLNLWREATLDSTSERPWPSLRQLLLSRTGAEVLHRLPDLTPNLQTLIIDEFALESLEVLAGLPLRIVEIREHQALLDLRALAGRELRLRLDPGGGYLGLDELGPGVRISYL